MINMKNFFREKKVYCGNNFMDVDIFAYSVNQRTQSTRGKRSKKKKVSKPKQRNLNDKNARRYLVQLANANFDEGDLHVTLTYKDKNLPGSIEEGEKIVANYLRRIKYQREKKDLPALKYILVTEYKTSDDGETPTRMHHHIIMDGALDRDSVEDLWRLKREKGKKKGEKIGFVNADRLQPDENGLAALANYLTKGRAKKKRWSCSQNLTKPYFRTNDHKYGKKQVEKMAKNVEDREFWEKKYPGWTLAGSDHSTEAKFNEFTGWSIYLKLRRIERRD